MLGSVVFEKGRIKAFWGPWPPKSWLQWYLKRAVLRHFGALGHQKVGFSGI